MQIPASLRSDFIHIASEQSIHIAGIRNRLHLVIESVRPDAGHARCSNVPVPADGAGGSGIG
jgi:hypothetical protein